VKLWDQRQGNPKSLISSHEQPERVYAMDIVKNMLVVATAGRRVQIYDTRNMAAPAQERVSSLKFGTSSLACMPDGSGNGHLALSLML
jgi:cell cycle arrest protein BUB3